MKISQKVLGGYFFDSYCTSGSEKWKFQRIAHSYRSEILRVRDYEIWIMEDMILYAVIISSRLSFSSGWPHVFALSTTAPGRFQIWWLNKLGTGIILPAIALRIIDWTLKSRGYFLLSRQNIAVFFSSWLSWPFYDCIFLLITFTYSRLHITFLGH